MSETVHRSRVLALCLALVGVVTAPRIAAASQEPGRGARAEHAITGEVKKVDHAASFMVMRTADGIDDTIRFTSRTTVRGLRDVTRAADTGARETFELTKDTVVDGSRGIEHVAVMTGGTIKKGANAVVHHAHRSISGN